MNEEQFISKVISLIEKHTSALLFDLEALKHGGTEAYRRKIATGLWKDPTAEKGEQSDN